ncbi:hypothetical protein LF41_634 [Lysobacter dokdonensis DS-58]|uniref:Bacteriocin n=1 Tax=Lysobacter dokdonensis DS-58 TaxID=1300345 RepID=A0A0A2WFT2_9GAMM|nr:hypothetical protein [Lysobacter dokdonensis]KGQ18608.1 hypothetical protein LF41_634 [Lysobacter dokdonensis DS-58]
MRDLTFEEIEMVGGEGVGTAFLTGAGAGGFAGALIANAPGAAIGALAGGIIGVGLYLL